MSLKNDILSAYGTCDTIQSLTGLSLRPLFGRELLEFYAAVHPEQKAQEEFAREYLLMDPAVQREILSPFSSENPERRKKAIEDFFSRDSQIYPEFSWIDDHFRSQNPKFPPLNQKLLHSIYSTVSDENPKALEWMKEWKDFRQADAIRLEKEEEEEKQRSLQEKGKALEKDLAELHSLIGLEGVKNDIEDLCAMIQVGKLRKEQNLKMPPLARHLVFSGNPGTGKTTVARLIARLYKDLGVLSKGQLVECDRSSLVAGHVGQTALKTRDMVKKALGGVLFIDEAYALARESPNDFGQEAIAVLLKEMEDHREDLVVIAAGYPDNMEVFLNSNPGLRSRFSKFIYFENYSGRQLMEILEKMVRDAQYELSAEARTMMEGEFDHIAAHPPVGFANGRYVRNRLENAICRQARRIWRIQNPDCRTLSTLEAADFA